MLTWVGWPGHDSSLARPYTEKQPWSSTESKSSSCRSRVWWPRRRSRSRFGRRCNSAQLASWRPYGSQRLGSLASGSQMDHKSSAKMTPTGISYDQIDLCEYSSVQNCSIPQSRKPILILKIEKWRSRSQTTFRWRIQFASLSSRASPASESRTKLVCSATIACWKHSWLSVPASPLI